MKVRFSDVLLVSQKKIQRQRTRLCNYKLCELVKVSYSSSDYFVRLLLSNQPISASLTPVLPSHRTGVKLAEMG